MNTNTHTNKFCGHEYGTTASNIANRQFAFLNIFIIIYIEIVIVLSVSEISVRVLTKSQCVKLMSIIMLLTVLFQIRFEFLILHEKKHKK